MFCVHRSIVNFGTGIAALRTLVWYVVGLAADNALTKLLADEGDHLVSKHVSE